MPAYPDIVALTALIEAALQRDDYDAARVALYPVAHVIALEEGARFRKLIKGLPEDLWHDDLVIASALGSSYRSAGSPAGSAALAYFRAAENLIAAASKPVPALYVVAIRTAHSAALRTQGRLSEAFTKLSEAERLLDGEAHGPRFVRYSAQHALELGVVELHLGRLASARQHLEYAHGLADAHLSRSEQIECLGTLALVAYSQGDLATTDRLLAEIAEHNAPDTVLRSGFAAAAYAADILVATDRHQIERVPALAEAMVAASIHTEWEPFASVVSAYSLALAREPITALDLLQQAHERYLTWQPPGIGLDVGEMLRADILSALDRGDEAFEILSHLNPHERHALCPERFMARIALQHGDLTGADLALSDCDMLGSEHSARTLVDVQLLRGALELERGDLGRSDINFDRALQVMARTGVRSPFRHVPPALLARLAERALQRTQGAETKRILERVAQATDGQVDDREHLSERERMVLVYVERNLTVAQIAAELFISPNTVKTHLRRLYSKLGVATRAEAIRKARSLGLHLDAGAEITRRSPAARDATGENPVV